MNKFALTAVASAVLAISAQAGQPMVQKNPKNPVVEYCFNPGELQLDTYAAYSNYKGDTGWGGGLALNYFFTNNIGAGLDVNYTDTDSSAFVYSAHVIARFPFEGSLCWAPYLKLSGGITDNDTTAGFFGAGGGVEFRVSPRIGIFAEGSFNWAAADEDFAGARAGVRFVF